MNTLYWELLIAEFNLKTPNTTYGEITAELDYINETFINDYSDLLLYSIIYRN